MTELRIAAFRSNTPLARPLVASAQKASKEDSDAYKD
jgi:hypothetical protein